MGGRLPTSKLDLPCLPAAASQASRGEERGKDVTGRVGGKKRRERQDGCQLLCKSLEGGAFSPPVKEPGWFQSREHLGGFWKQLPLVIYKIKLLPFNS